MYFDSWKLAIVQVIFFIVGVLLTLGVIKWLGLAGG